MLFFFMLFHLCYFLIWTAKVHERTVTIIITNKYMLSRQYSSWCRLPHASVYCLMHQFVASCISLLPHASVCWLMHQFVASCISLSPHASAYCLMHQFVASCISLSSHASVCCLMHQFVASCISLLPDASVCCLMHQFIWTKYKALIMCLGIHPNTVFWSW